AIEPSIRTPGDLCRQAEPLRLQLRGGRRTQGACALAPRAGLLARVEQEELQPLTEPVVQPFDDPGVKEEPRRERVRKDEPDRSHEAVRARSAKAMRSASDAPSSPWKRSASDGVPHAGQPSTPNTVTDRPSSARRSASPSAPVGAWSSTTNTSSNGSASSRAQSASTRFSQGMFT